MPAFRFGYVATSVFVLLALSVVIGTSLTESGYRHVPPDEPGPR